MNARFVVLAGRTGHAPPPADYLDAYATYHSVWGETFRAIRGDAYVHPSNDFTRQDYIQALFDGPICAGLDCVRRVRLDSPADLDDSWLEPWPAEVLRELAAEDPAALVNSYFTVHRDYRRHDGRSGHPVGYLLGCLSVLHQLELGSRLMLGMMRCDRSMNKLAAVLGATTLVTTTVNGSETDLVVFRAERVREAARSFPRAAFELFDARQEQVEEERWTPQTI
jgi:hypothetical protein